MALNRLDCIPPPEVLDADVYFDGFSFLPLSLSVRKDCKNG
jgi:hypothetical protein